MKCSVENCGNSSRGRNRKTGVSFHYFPTDEEMGIKWMHALGWKNRILSANTRICSDHFEERYKDKSLGFKVRLRKDAIPTIFHGREDPFDNLELLPADSVIIDYSHEVECESENVMVVPEEEVNSGQDFEDMYRNQSRLVQGLYQELQMSESESTGLRQELEELEMKFSKMQTLMRLMTPFERLVVEQELFPEAPSVEINKFATSLYNISPMAYDFVQKSLLTSLPDVESFVEGEIGQ